MQSSKTKSLTSESKTLATKKNRSGLILSATEFCSKEVYRMMEQVYSESEYFSDELSNKYASFNDFHQEFTYQSKDPDTIFLVYSVDKKAKGYIVVAPNKALKLRHTADLNMGLVKDACGCGIGAKLLEMALKQLKNLGRVEIVYLHVRADNSPGRKLYRKANFEEIAILTRDTKVNDCYYDGVLMRKFL